MLAGPFTSMLVGTFTGDSFAGGYSYWDYNGLSNGMSDYDLTS